MKLTNLKLKQGFTLVEILIVMAILGVIMGVVYSVYLTHQKSAYTQEEVVDVQQNLRMAMDTISRDIRMAGMLVPATTTPIATGTGTRITINTASARNIYARINAAPAVAGGSDTVTCTVESADAVDIFDANSGNPVKLIRPVDCGQPFATTYSVTASDRTAPSLTLKRSSGYFSAGDVIKRGDMIAMSDAGAPDPNTITYTVVDSGTVVNNVACPQNQRCLVRIANCTDVDSTCFTNGTSNIIAGYISNPGLQLSYLQDNSTTETNTPSASDLSTVRAVRVTITGQTASVSPFMGGPKTRQVTSVIKIRDRRQ